VELGRAIVGGTTWALGAFMFAQVARLPHRIEVKAGVATVRTLLRTRRFTLTAPLAFEIELTAPRC
jgi:hypothetical protein